MRSGRVPMAERDARAASFEALREDLLDGRFDGLGTHLAALEALEADLAAGRVPAADLTAIRQAADQSGQLLTASARGVKAALRRLRESTGADSAYTSDGRLVPLAPPARGPRV